MILQNIKTGERQLFKSRDEINQAVLSGEYQPLDSKPVTIYDPEDKKRTPLEVPVTNLPEAIKSGYLVQTPFERVVDKSVKENKGIFGDLKVGALQFADEVLGGIPELAYDHLASPLEVAQKEAVKKDHELANTLGGIGGFIGGVTGVGPAAKAATSALGLKGLEAVAPRALNKGTEALVGRVAENLSTKLGEGFSKSAYTQMAKKIVSSASGMAVEGAALATPYALTEAALGDPDHAAESLMTGGIIGGLLGGGGKALGEFSKAAKSVYETSGARERLSNLFQNDASLKSIARKSAIRALNPTVSKVSKLRSLAESVTDDGISFLSPEKSIDGIADDLIKERIFDGLTSKGEMLSRLESKTSSLGGEIDNLLSRYETDFGAASHINTEDVINNIRNRISSKFTTGATSYVKDGIDDLIKKRIAILGEKIPLSQASLEKTAWQGEVKKLFGTEVAPLKEGVKEISRAFNDEIRKKIGELNPNLSKEILSKQRLYGNLKQAQEIAQLAADKELANNQLGLTSYMLGAGLPAAGAVLGGAPGAVALTLGGVAVRELSRRYGDQFISKLASSNNMLLLAEKSMKSLADKAAVAPKWLEAVSGKYNIELPSARGSSLEAIRRLMTPEKTREEKLKKYDRSINQRLKDFDELKKKVEEWTLNPVRLNEVSAKIAEPFNLDSAPNIGGALSNQITKQMNYLYNEMPKSSKKDPIFSSQVKWRPSGSELSRFEDKVMILQDPMQVFNLLESGELNRNHIHSLEANYPKLLSFIKDKMASTIYEKKLDIPYTKRLKLSLLMGMNLDPSLDKKTVSYYQQTWVKENQQMAASEADMSMPHEAGFKASVDMAKMEYSDLQARSLRRMG